VGKRRNTMEVGVDPVGFAKGYTQTGMMGPRKVPTFWGRGETSWKQECCIRKWRGPREILISWGRGGTLCKSERIPKALRRDTRRLT